MCELFVSNIDTNIDRMSLPTMVEVLIACHEPYKYTFSNFNMYPIYKLIKVAFSDPRMSVTNQYMESLKVLLDAKSEQYVKGVENQDKSNGARDKFVTLGDCIIHNAANSKLLISNPEYVQELILRFLEQVLNSQTFRDKYHITKTLYRYISHGHDLGLDSAVLRLLLRFGADPNEVTRETTLYPVNIYFEHLFPFLETVDISDCMEIFVSQIDVLMVLCKRMLHRDLHKAIITFLDRQIAKAGFQGSYIAKYFCHVAGALVVKPRTLRDISAHSVWYNRCRMKHEDVTRLTTDPVLLALVLP